MSDLTHTAEPWSTAYRQRRDGQYAQEIFDASGELIATLAWYSVREGSTIHTNREENGRRIVACVNACRGMSIDYLEKVAPVGALIMSANREALAEQAKVVSFRERDAAMKMVGELVAMLKEYAPSPCECEMCQCTGKLFTRAQALLKEHPETVKEMI